MGVWVRQGKVEIVINQIMLIGLYIVNKIGNTAVFI